MRVKFIVHQIALSWGVSSGSFESKVNKKLELDIGKGVRVGKYQSHRM